MSVICCPFVFLFSSFRISTGVLYVKISVYVSPSISASASSSMAEIESPDRSKKSSIRPTLSAGR